MSRKERSKRMSLIKSKWTRPERLVHNYLKGYKIKHIMHSKINGSADIIIPSKKIAIFIHGCFWHGCKTCYQKPVNNRKFWVNKIKKNIQRDERNVRLSKKNGWKVKIVWECEIPRRDPEESLRKLMRNL